MKGTLSYRSAVTVALAGLLVQAGCSDNPVDPTHEDEHAAATRVELYDHNALAYAYDATDGTVSCDAEPCLLSIDDSRTALFDLVFKNADGEILAADHLDEDFSLRVEVADPGLATVSAGREQELHRLSVEPVRSGETRLRISLLHGDHADFSTPPFDDTRALLLRTTE